MNNEKIYGGGFLLARQIFNSEVWCKKPSSWGKIWIYILGKVHHEQTNDFGRGEGFFNFSQEKKLIGIDITDDIIKKFMCFARTSLMISTRRSTRGVVIKILQYNKFQDFNNYKSTSSGTREAREKHERSTTINNNVKKVKKEKNILPFQEMASNGYQLSLAINYWNTLVIENYSEAIRLYGFLKKCRGETEQSKKLWLKIKPSKEDWEMAVKNYLVEINERDYKNDFAKHRFSFYEFVKQANGYIKYLNK